MKYYKTRLDAEKERNNGDKIYFIDKKGYYIVKNKKNFIQKFIYYFTYK